MVASSAGSAAEGTLVDGRYRLEEPIGRGGTAEVFRAYDTQTGRRVALKRCLPAAAAALSERRRGLLEREFYTLVQLAHPRIIEVYDYGVCDAGAYYTMELLQDGDLSGAGRWHWQRACALLVDVASSLAILHSRGLLHRDVSARNVRCGADQRAKLIDFGALASIGSVLEVVGTPPYVPPEALQMQGLDARADLFALGALAYYLLTGRHAFPARKLADLRDAWRSSPMPLGRLAPDLPDELVTLITQLLSLDRTTRPDSAADVMRRLCLIAELPIGEELAVSRAYLTTPVLVGRESLQITLHKALLRLMSDGGETLLIDGPEGSGRTRALDVCVLDGRMLGVHVVRADASLGVDGDWGVARAILAQLMERLPSLVQAAALPLTPWLGPSLAELRSSAAPERVARIRGLRDIILSLCQRERLLIAVDDVDNIDEPSLALLAALSGHAEGRGLLLVVTLSSAPVRAARERNQAALSMLRARGRRLPLHPLSRTQTQALLRSVFGGSPEASALATRLHELARGNPRNVMELAQHLVERGQARYEAGSWLLPAELADSDLPPSVADSVLDRLRGLSADARELAELSAVSQLPGIAAEQYEALCVEWEHSRLYRALQELIAARVLRYAPEHYALYSRAYRQVLIDAMSPQRARSVHVRWARELAGWDADVLLRVSHLFDADRADEGLALLLSLDMRTRHPPVGLLARALALAEGAGLPRRDKQELRLGLLTSAVFTLDVASFSAWAPRVLEQLVDDSGLAAYAELARAVPSEELLAAALALTAQRRDRADEQNRGHTSLEARLRLQRLASAHCVMALWTYDAGLLDAFPSLAPLASLSPLIDLTSELLAITRDWCAGRLRLVLTGIEGMLRRVAGPLPELDPVQHGLLSNTLHLLAGTLKASYGVRECERHARVLASDDQFRAAGWRIRQLYQLSQGDLLEAAGCGRRADVIRLQQGGEPIADTGLEAAELYASVMLGDEAALRAAVERVTELAGQYPGWQPLAYYGRSHLEAAQDRWGQALEQVERGLAHLQLGRHNAYVRLASWRVRVLCALGRVDEAVVASRAYEAALADMQIAPSPLMAAAAAEALARAGSPGQAMLGLERAAKQAAELALSGLLLGQLFETAGYVALELRDEARFEVSFTACAFEYKQARCPAAAARLTRLFEAARAQQLRVIQLAALLDEAGVGVIERLDQALLRDRFGECVDRADRAHCALSFVLAQSERARGYLFALSEQQVVLLGGIPEDQAPAELFVWTQTWLGRQAQRGVQGVTETLELVTESEAGTAQVAGPDELTLSQHALTGDGREFEPLLLTHHEQIPLGVLMLEVGPGMRLMPTRSVLSDVVSLLQEYGDLQGG